jgi:hypothetical protein
MNRVPLNQVEWSGSYPRTGRLITLFAMSRVLPAEAGPLSDTERRSRIVRRRFGID